MTSFYRCLLQQLALSELRHFGWDKDPANTMAYCTVFSGNHDEDWTIWEMVMTAHLIKKGLDKCLDPNFKTKLPIKENGPFNLAVEEEK